MFRSVPKKTLTCLLGFLLLTTTLVSGVLIEFEGSTPVEHAGVPKAMRSVINAYSRVYGYAVDNRACFYFRGHVERLNGFLEQMTKCDTCQLEAMLTTNPGTADRPSSFVSTSTRKTGTFEYDWCLMLEKVTAPPAKEGLQAPATRRGTFWIAQVVIPVKSQKALVALRLPLQFRAALVGDVATFVKLHNDRRTKAAGGAMGTPTVPRSPTSWEMVQSGNAYGAPGQAGEGARRTIRKEGTEH